jgi:hypothetical protein
MMGDGRLRIYSNPAAETLRPETSYPDYPGVVW